METCMGEIVMTSTLEQRIKQYWNNQPCNIRHSGNEIGSLDFFKEVSARRFQVEPHIPEFAGFHLWQGKQVLEIGPGIGSDAAEFARHGADYYGIDYSEESVKLARKRLIKLSTMCIKLSSPVANSVLWCMPVTVGNRP
jgi:2-polyprenyl-3-methyl-5-hydroxy-6-metoxy-1,4-benzoquinol methylase